jgi:DNA modification methylase
VPIFIVITAQSAINNRTTRGHSVQKSRLADYPSSSLKEVKIGRRSSWQQLGTFPTQSLGEQRKLLRFKVNKWSVWVAQKDR